MRKGRSAGTALPLTSPPYRETGGLSLAKGNMSESPLLICWQCIEKWPVYNVLDSKPGLESKRCFSK